MTKTPITIDAMRRAAARLDGRSALYRWLYEHHDVVVESVAGRIIRWQSFCALFAEAGLTDANGNPPSERTARETWYKVRREIARQRRAADAGPVRSARAGMPSRQPADWQPPLATAAAPLPSLMTSDFPSATGPGSGAAPIDMSAKAQIGRVKARMDRNRL